MKELEAKKPDLMEKIENMEKEYSSTKSIRKRNAEKLCICQAKSVPIFN
jgi:hypothetical protein